MFKLCPIPIKDILSALFTDANADRRYYVVVVISGAVREDGNGEEGIYDAIAVALAETAGAQSTSSAEVPLSLLGEGELESAADSLDFVVVDNPGEKES